jgi:hypothetical protein
MKFLQKILLIVMIGAFGGSSYQVYAMVLFGALPVFPPAPPGAVVRIGPATAVAPIDINNWDNALPSTIANDIFPAGAFTIPGNPAVANNAIIHEMFHYFRSGGRKPHVALARIVIIGTNGTRYVYAIPRVFVSGANHNNAIVRWNVPARLVNYLNLANAIIPVVLPLGLPPARPIDNIVKGIGDYDFTCQLNGQYTSFAHSERAAILSVLYDANDSIGNAIAIFNAMVPPAVGIAQVVVQIKIAHVNGVCASCRRFFNHTSGINNAYEIPGLGVFRPRPGAPACNFGNPTNVGNVNYLIRDYMIAPVIAMALNVPQVNLRVSHITVGIPLAIPAAPLASVVNGF